MMTSKEEEQTPGEIRGRTEEWNMGKAVELRDVEIAALKPYERNAKQHSKEQVEKIGDSIRRLGFLSPCLIDQDMNVIAGHGRIMAAKQIGWDRVPCVFIEGLTAEERKAYILADNRLTELGEWNMDMVQQELAALADADFDISITGFDTDLRFDDSMAQITDDGWTDAEVHEAEEPRSRIGDIYQLGNHRLMCGDSTDPDMVAALMDGTQADLLVTDPPYGVAYEDKIDRLNRWLDPEHINRKKGKQQIKNDGSETEAEETIRKAIKNADQHMKKGAVFYIWHQGLKFEIFRNACQDTGWTVKQLLIWVKNSFVPGLQDYQWKHEPCLYGWKDGAAHYFLDSRKQTTVIEDPIPDFRNMKKDELLELVEKIFDEERTPTTVIHEAKPLKSDLHPTMKPVKLIARLIRNSSEPGQTVLDLFGGSGTTLIACEQMDRRCCMMEFDPHYADVIVDRWEKMTGLKALKVNGYTIGGVLEDSVTAA